MERENNVNKTVLFTMFAALVLSIIIGIGWYLTRDAEEQARFETSEAGELQTFRLAGDAYDGYFFWRSPEMKKLLPRAGYSIDFTDDGGAYVERNQKFAKGEYDAMLIPIGEYLLHGKNHNFPGVVVAAIADSKGMDAIVGFGDAFPKGELSELNNSTLRIAYIAGSPSHFLLDLTIDNFDLHDLANNKTWRVEVKTPEELIRLARSGQVDAIVTWEPYISQALALADSKYIWGSDKFAGYIVDYLVVHRDYLRAHSDDLEKVLATYFRVQSTYANKKDRLITDMSQLNGLSEEQVRKTLPKIDWFDLSENAQSHFGVSIQSGMSSSDGIYDTILSCTNVLLNSGRLKSDPLDDMRLIVNGSLIKNLVQRAPNESTNSTQKTDFASLSDSEWDALKQIRALRSETITFKSGTSDLTEEGKSRVDAVALLLAKNYGEFRILISGHTGQGNEEINLNLSKARSDTVTQRLIAVHGLDKDRIRAVGMGSSQPPERRKDESNRGYNSRWSRVEFVLVENNNL